MLSRGVCLAVHVVSKWGRTAQRGPRYPQSDAACCAGLRAPRLAQFGPTGLPHPPCTSHAPPPPHTQALDPNAESVVRDDFAIELALLDE